MHTRSRIGLWTYLAPLTLATALYLPGIFFPKWMTDGGLYAAVSLRMARTGEWWTPMQANATYFNKPPLAFWTHALFVRVLGEADWVLRLPNLLSALACVALLVSIVKRLHGPRVALLAGVLLALTAEYIWRISRFRLDYMHTALMLGCVRLAVEGTIGACQAPGPGVRPGMPPRAKALLAVSGVPIGLAMLVKPIFGLLAIVLMALWVVLWRASTPSRANSPRPPWSVIGWLGVAAAGALATAAPWHLGMWLRHGDAFIERFFIGESLTRATGERFGREPWWWYLHYLIFNAGEVGQRLRIAAGAVYWPVLACAVLALAWWALGRRLAPRLSKRGGLLAQVYTFGLLVALSAFSDKRGWYLIPLYPGIAWIGAMWIAAVLPRGAMRRVWRLSGVAGAGVLMLTIALGLRFERGQARTPDLSGVIGFVEAHREGEFWNGSLHRYENSPIYIRTGVWPKLLEDPNTGERWTPRAGDYLVYDLTRSPKPEPADRVVLAGERFVVVQRAATSGGQ